MLLTALSTSSPSLPYEAKAQSYLPHQPILIFHNTGFTQCNCTSGGDGTGDHPYIIQGWEITNFTATGQAGIHVMSTSAHFIIRNNYIHPASQVLESSGILFETVANGIVDNNRVTHTTYGVWVSASTGNRVENNYVTGNKNGIYLTSSSGNNITDNKASDTMDPSAGYGIWVTSSSSHNRVKGNNASNNFFGFFVSGASNYNVLERNTVANNSQYGFYTFLASNNIYRNNTVLGNQFGMIFYASSNHTAIDNTFIGNNFGMGLEVGGAPSNVNNTFTRNKILYSSRFGAYITDGTRNIIYNNYFLRNPVAAFDDTMQNAWNTTKTVGPNIVGGPFLGGNYYSDYTSSDRNGDGIWDQPYKISGGNNYDWLPLVASSGGTLHDIVVDSLIVTPQTLHTGQIVTITVPVSNQGTVPENFTVKAFHNNTLIGDQKILNLRALASTSVTFQWAETTIPSVSFIKANATAVPGEVDIANNNSPPITVTIVLDQPPVASFTVSTANPVISQQVSQTLPAAPTPTEM